MAENLWPALARRGPFSLAPNPPQFPTDSFGFWHDTNTGDLRFWDGGEWDVVGGGSGATYPEVATHALLPTATGSGDIYVVQTTTGIPLINRKPAGLWRDSGSWSYLGNGISASDVINVPAGDIVATDVQAAISELDATAAGLQTATNDLTLFTNQLTGWGAYVNTAAAQAIVATTSTALVNNAGTVIETQKPSDIATFYTAGKITGREGDGILINIELTFTPSSGLASYLRVSIDIGGAVGEIYIREFSTVLGSGIGHALSYSTGAYTLDTWEANGGTIKVYSDGPGTISGVRYVIHRLHKA